jgi:putative MATE family efflux protein
MAEDQRTGPERDGRRKAGTPAARRDLTSGSISRALVALAVPIVLANVLQTVYQLIDTFWVGRLGAAAVAAVSVSFPILFVAISLGGGLAIAGAILVAQAYGAGDAETVDHVSAQTLLAVGTVSVLLSAAGYFAAEPLMGLFAPDAAVHDMASDYLRISFLGIAAIFLYFVVQSLMRGVGDVRTPLWIVSATVLLNFFLDPLFILGWGPVPEMGVAGAAMATVATQALAAVAGVWVLTLGRFGIHLRLRDLKPDLPLAGRILRLGVPASLEQSARGFGFSVMMLLVTGFGTTVTAAYGIGTRVFSFIIIPALGLSMATTTLVGQNVGARRPERAEQTARTATTVAFAALSAAGIVLFLFAAPVIRLFVPDEPEVVRIGSHFLRIMALSFGFVGVQQVLSGALRGAGNTTASLLLTAVSLWVFLFPIAWILSARTDLGATGIWWAYPVSNVAGATLAVAWFLRGRWQRTPQTGDARLEEEVAREAIVEEGLSS